LSETDAGRVASPLETGRARAQSRAATVVEDRDTYVHQTWARLAARMLRERGISDARVSPNLRAVHLEDLRAGGIDPQVDRELYVAGRRHKSAAEAATIQAAQSAAESALVEVVRGLSEAEIRDGVLWSNGGPLASEQLYARAQLLLGKKGYTWPDMLIAGSPALARPA